ncbi:MAG: hypothetical protein SynsKO_30860 [Synoicihabitans sp.]
MTHIFGATVMAVSTVLAAFMTGLALGSYYLGKKGDKSENPLKRYAIYEVGIGLAALVTLVLLDQIAPLSVWMTRTFGYSFTLFSVGRFIVVFLLILIPTTLMGATLPILSRFMIKRFEQMGRSLGSLYVSNTLGAVFGGLVAGFYLIGSLGIHNSIYLAVVLNIAVGIASWFVAKQWESSPVTDARVDRKTPQRTASERPSLLLPRQRRLLLGGFALSGVTSFAYQVLWTRALVFYVGNSTYAFTIMLTTFLVGIAIGGYLVRFFVDRLKDPMRCFAWVQVATGVSAVVALPLLNVAIGSSGVVAWFQSMDFLWASTVLSRFVISFSLMLIPTILVGMTFPLVGKILVTDLERTGEDVGKVYAVNTLGNIAGALLPAFVLVPLFGINKGILAMSVMNVAIGILLMAYGREKLPRLRHLAPVSVVVLLTLVLVVPLTSQFSSDTESAADEVLFYREGVVGTTKVYVKHDTGEKHISVDGVQIGGTNVEIDYKQQWLAHLPKLLMSDYRSELSIGLGSGILIGESARHPALERIVGVEIAPSVVEGAHFFADENNGILESPRVEVVVNDGVNYLLTTEESFDIISTDGKTLPEYGVNGVFFSREYYRLMRDHLNPGGVAVQWIPTHYPPNVFQTVLRTFTAVFPHTLLWYAESNCFLVGSNHEIVFDQNVIEQKLSVVDGPFEGLRKFGITSAESLLSHLIAAEDVLREQTAHAPENSLEKPVVEFYDFRDYAASESERKFHNLEFFLAVRGTGSAGERIRALSGEMAAAYRAEGAYLLGQKNLIDDDPETLASQHFDEALALDPDNEDVRYHIYGHVMQSVRNFMDAQHYTRAEPFLREAIQLRPGSTEARNRYGVLLMSQNRPAEAVREFQALVALEPDNVAARHQLASIYSASNQPDLAIFQYRSILKTEPRDAQALFSLAHLIAAQQAFPEALDLFKQAYLVAPRQPDIIDSYAWLSYLLEDWETARTVVQQGGDYYRANPEFEQRRRTILGTANPAGQ